MDSQRFDAITRSFAATRSRRAALRTMAAGALATGHGRDDATAKNKKRKKIKKNAFGCVNVGGKCQGKNSACCSGICQGKKPRKGEKDKSKCVAHNVLDCPAGADACLQAVPCGTGGTCFQTTGRASFCGEANGCVACKKDADCEALRGPGAACIFCPGPCSSTGDTSCAVAAG